MRQRPGGKWHVVDYEQWVSDGGPRHPFPTRAPAAACPLAACRRSTQSSRGSRGRACLSGTAVTLKCCHSDVLDATACRWLGAVTRCGLRGSRCSVVHVPSAHNSRANDVRWSTRSHAPVGDDAAAVQAAQDLGGGCHQDAARRLQVDHVRRRVHHPQRPAMHHLNQCQQMTRSSHPSA